MGCSHKASRCRSVHGLDLTHVTQGNPTDACKKTNKSRPYVSTISASHAEKIL